MEKVTKTESVFHTLSKIDCRDKTEKKNGLTYLSWAWAWGIVKETYPSANYEITMWDGKPYLYDEALGYLVQTTVSIDGEKISMQLPVMDGANKAQKAQKYTYKTKYGEKEVEAATMFDINTAIMRCLTKNLAMFGLGHYIYAGEDMPESVDDTQQNTPAKTVDVKPKPVKKEEPKSEPPVKETTNEDRETNLTIALQEIKEAKTVNELLEIYKRWSVFTDNKKFMTELSNHKNKLTNVN